MTYAGYIIIYLAVISLISVYLTVYDKQAARRGSWRVKEWTLLLFSALGGSIAMLATMRYIRHKTKHSKFMVGIPAIIIVQIALVSIYVWRIAKP